MKSSLILISSLIILFVYMISPCLSSHYGSSKSQSIEFKEGYSHKKNGLSKNSKQDYFSRYQDWDGEDWSDEDMMQHPIDEAPRKNNRPLGEMCSYSTDCKSGCCLLERETKIRSCQKKAIRGEKCTSAQVKGDLYVDACPCLSGDDFCAFPDGFCTN